MPQAFKVPQIDVANIASKLPEPLRKSAGMAFQGLMDIFGGDADVSSAAPTPLTPAAAAVRIPLSRLQNLFKSGFADDMIQGAKSPALREMYDPDEIMSDEIARLASGMRSAEGAYLSTGTAPKPVIPGLDLMPPRSKADSRLASQELYNISQRALDELRVPKGESVEVFRSGPIPQAGHILTPTHIEPDMAQFWNKTPFGAYNVPREQIRALVGLLRRGDEITAGELLIPSHSLAKGAKLPIERAPSRVDEELTRIPSWFKKSVR
mgnify:CR=1 FL=1